jgi:hypothetical protein
MRLLILAGCLLVACGCSAAHAPRVQCEKRLVPINAPGAAISGAPLKPDRHTSPPHEDQP